MGLNSTVEERDASIAELNSTVEEKEEQIRVYELASAEAKARIAELELELKQCQKELKQALAKVHAVEKKQAVARAALEAATNVQETLSCIHPWKTNYIDVLEAAFSVCEGAGLKKDELKKYEKIIEQEKKKRIAREELEKMSRIRGISKDQIKKAKEKALAAGLNKDEVMASETAWFARSGEV